MRLSKKQAVSIAAVIALVVALLVYVVLSRQAQPVAPVEPTEVAVVVAKTNIPAMTEITEGMVETKTIPKAQAQPNYLSDPTMALGRVTQFELSAGQPLTRTDVVAASAQQGLTFVIPEGMRAITVALDPISGVGGFAQPNDRVDVLATFEQEDLTITKTVLQDVVVLAVNEQTMRPPPRKQVTTEEGAETKEDKAPATEQVKSATIAVTPHQAQILVLSAAKGTVHLALRARGDHEFAPLEASNAWALVGRRPPPAEPTPEAAAAAEEEKAKEEKAETKIEEAKKEPEKPAGPPPPTVEVIRGNQREVVTMQKP